MTVTQSIDLAVYDIRVQLTPNRSARLFATVQDLPGCFAVADSVAALNAAVEQAIFLHLEDHPDAPARFRR